MIARRELHIVDMAAYQPRDHLRQPFSVIKQSQIVAYLGVTEIMPVTNGTVSDFLEKATKLSLGWKSLDSDPVFNTQGNAGCFRVGEGRLQPFDDAIIRRNGLPFPDGFQFKSHIAAIEISSGENGPDELLRVVPFCHRTKVHYHAVDSEPLRIVDGLESVMSCAVSFAFARRSTLVTVRRRTLDLDGKRTEIVEARYRHRMVGQELFDALPKRLPDPVTQFDTVEIRARRFPPAFRRRECDGLNSSKWRKQEA